MKSKLFALLCIGGCWLCMAFAPGPQKVSKEEIENRKKMYKPLFGGCTGVGSGSIAKADFLAAMQNPICITDSSGKITYPVANFEIAYCEKTVAEDSTGLPFISIDCITDMQNSASFDSRFKKLFTEHLYKGDSISITNITIRLPKGNLNTHTGLKLLITK